jgi:hypothetical protein
MFRICHSISRDFRSRGQHLVNEPSSTRLVYSGNAPGAATETPPLASVDNSSGSIVVSGAGSPPYPRPAATGNDSWNNWRSAKPSNPGPSSGRSQPNRGRFRRLRASVHGVISSPVAPHTATLVRFDFYGDESGNETVATKKGSYEMQGDAVEMQIRDPNAV